MFHGTLLLFVYVFLFFFLYSRYTPIDNAIHMPKKENVSYQENIKKTKTYILPLLIKRTQKCLRIYVD